MKASDGSMTLEIPMNLHGTTIALEIIFVVHPTCAYDGAPTEWDYELVKLTYRSKHSADIDLSHLLKERYLDIIKAIEQVASSE